jgi:hypothetical protein
LPFKCNLQRYNGEEQMHSEEEESEEGEGEGEHGWVRGAFSVRVAYFEIAGKRCTDLLSPQRTEIALKEMGGGLVGAGAGWGYTS